MRRPRSVRPASGAMNPSRSVFRPSQPSGDRRSVFTAPIAAVRSSAGRDACRASILNGAVTDAPSTPKAAANASKSAKLAAASGR